MYSTDTIIGYIWILLVLHGPSWRWRRQRKHRKCGQLLLGRPLGIAVQRRSLSSLSGATPWHHFGKVPESVGKSEMSMSRSKNPTQIGLSSWCGHGNGKMSWFDFSHFFKNDHVTSCYIMLLVYHVEGSVCLLCVAAEWWRCICQLDRCDPVQPATFHRRS